MDGHMGMRMLVKAILGVLLVSVIFSMGFRLGIVVGSIGGEYNHHRMMYDDSGWNSPVMMYGYAPDASVVSPTAGSTSSKK